MHYAPGTCCIASTLNKYLTSSDIPHCPPLLAEQVSLAQAREDRLTAEAVSDRIRTTFGPGVIDPAAALRRAS